MAAKQMDAITESLGAVRTIRRAFVDELSQLELFLIEAVLAANKRNFDAFAALSRAADLEASAIGDTSITSKLASELGLRDEWLKFDEERFTRRSSRPRR